MRILITGGTGFIGGHIRDAILRRPGLGDGTLIRCMTRDASGKTHGDPRVSFVAGDVRDEASLACATEGVDVAVHCVQFPNHPVENPSKGHTYLEIDAGGTRRLAAACRRSAVRRIVYLSGAGTSEDRPEPWFRAKVVAERAVRESGCEWTILRPSWVYGPEDHSLNRFVAFIRLLPVVPVIGDGKNKVQPVAIWDVADAAADSVLLDAAMNETIGLGGPEELTMDEILATVQRVMGTRRRLIHQPRWLVKLAVAPLALLPRPPLSPAAVDFILQEAIVDIGPARRIFGRDFMSLETGLRKYLEN